MHAPTITQPDAHQLRFHCGSSPPSVTTVLSGPVVRLLMAPTAPETAASALSATRPGKADPLSFVCAKRLMAV